MLAFFEEYAIFFIIFLLMLLVGMYFARKERERAADNSANYRKALTIERIPDFNYGMRTNVGYAFVHGIVSAINPINPAWLDREILAYKIITEEYREHIDYVPVTHFDKNNTPFTKTEIRKHYSWDTIKTEENHVDQIKFRDLTLGYNVINLPEPKYEKTETIGFNIRNKYFVLNNDLEGSIFTYLTRNGISENSKFFEGLSAANAKIKAIKDEINRVKTFWILWTLVTIATMIIVFIVKNKFSL